MCVYCEKPRNDMSLQADRFFHKDKSMRIKETAPGIFRIAAVFGEDEPSYMESERISYCPFCGRLLRSGDE